MKTKKPVKDFFCKAANQFPPTLPSNWDDDMLVNYKWLMRKIRIHRIGILNKIQNAITKAFCNNNCGKKPALCGGCGRIPATPYVRIWQYDDAIETAVSRGYMGPPLY